MKKAEQIAINEIVIDALEYYDDRFTKGSDYTRLDYCTAWVFDIISVKTGEVIGSGLISYNTMIAYCVDGVVYDFLRLVYGYTPTSAKHISKFAKFTKAKKVLSYKPI